MEDCVKYGLIVFVIILSLLVLSKLPGLSVTRGEKVTIEQIRALGEEAKRLYYMAKQDQNPILSLMHATIALSKLHTLKIVGPIDRISKKVDINIDALKEEIVTFHRVKIQEINKKCPSLSLVGYEIDCFF